MAAAALLALVAGASGPFSSREATAAPQFAAERSVAVLPFASFSTDRADGYFADALTEEVIGNLAGRQDLKVAGRTASFYFKDRRVDLAEVRDRLAVAYVVTGSVRRTGDRVRVTVALAEAGDGFHLWSATYERKSNDSFALQRDISAKVVDELELRLAGVAGAADWRARMQDRPPTMAALDEPPPSVAPGGSGR